LKSVLIRGASGFLSGLIGLEVARFLKTEFSEVRSLRADLLGGTRDNDSRMAFRMLDYLLAIEREYHRVAKKRCGN
jgi:hypothetical protein